MLFLIRLSNVCKTLSKNFEIFYYLNVAHSFIDLTYISIEALEIEVQN